MDTRRAGDLVDDRGHPQFLDHLPGRGDVAEGPVLALVGPARVFAGQTIQDLPFGAPVHLIDRGMPSTRADSTRYTYAWSPRPFVTIEPIFWVIRLPSEIVNTPRRASRRSGATFAYARNSDHTAKTMIFETPARAASPHALLEGVMEI